MLRFCEFVGAGIFRGKGLTRASRAIFDHNRWHLQAFEAKKATTARGGRIPSDKEVFALEAVDPFICIHNVSLS